MRSTPTYLLDYLPVESERLLAMAELLGPEVKAVCERAGLRPGGRAIDVGCGPLGALTALRQVVGAEGEVVGVDANPAAVETARTIVDNLGLTNVRVVAADINDAMPAIAEPATFDLAFSRLVLMHQPDPAASMARIAELLRPGGALVAFDMLRGPLVEPSSPSLDRAWELLRDGMRTVGAQPDTARRYPPLAADAGLEVVSQRGVFFPAPPPAAIGETSNLLRAATGAITAAGLATRDEIEKLLHEMGVDQERAAFATTPFAIELIARKPA